jgi:hypothetical protein
MEIVLLYSYLHIQMRTKRGERLKTQAYYWIDPRQLPTETI